MADEYSTHDDLGLDDEDELTFRFVDDDGAEHEMLLVSTFDVDDHTYAVLVHKDDPEADGVILKVADEEGELFLVNIEDDDEWDKVVSIYEQISDQQDD